MCAFPAAGRWSSACLPACSPSVDTWSVQSGEFRWGFFLHKFCALMLLFQVAHVHCSRALSQVLRQDGRDVPDGETVR